MTHVHVPPTARRRLVAVAAAVGTIAGGALALAAPAAAVDPATIYVSTHGFDGVGCGQFVEFQCKTIQYAVDLAQPGDTVQVKAGTYNEDVFITKGITLQGAGAGQTIIDGSGVDQTKTEAGGIGYGVVFIGTKSGTDPMGDTTVDGFTIENPFAFTGSTGEPETVALRDVSDQDHITISDNTIKGWAADTATADYPIGIDTLANAATTTISNNDISGTFQGALLEDNGPVDFTGNTVHDLISSGGAPAEGVFVLADSGTPLTKQNVTDNTFENFAGLGVAYSAGYAGGNCSVDTCDGSISGNVTGNSFDLGGVTGGAALRFRSVDTGNALDLTVSGNTGTVAGPTTTIKSTPGNGAIDLTTTDAPNMISTDPAPSLQLDDVAVHPGDVTPKFVMGTANNPMDGADLDNVRYDLTITGSSGITADQIDLEYNLAPDGASDDWAPVPLSGSTADGDSITGYFGPHAGFPLPANGTPRNTLFRLSVHPDAPAGRLTTGVAIDQVDPNGSHAVLNTVATGSATDTVAKARTTVDATASPASPTTADRAKLDVTVTSTGSVDGGTVTVTDDADARVHDSATVSGGTASLRLRRLPAGTNNLTVAFSGTHSAAAAQQVLRVYVTKARTTMDVTTTPAHPTSADHPVVHVHLDTAGWVRRGRLTVTGDGVHVSAPAAWDAAIRLPKLPGGTYHLTVRYSGTATTRSARTTLTLTVTRVTTTLTLRTKPSPLRAGTTGNVAIVGASAPGATARGGTVRLQRHHHTLGSAVVRKGVAKIKLPRLRRSVQHWTVRYSGTPTAAPATLHTTVTVH